MDVGYKFDERIQRKQIFEPTRDLATSGGAGGHGAMKMKDTDHRADEALPSMENIKQRRQNAGASAARKWQS